MKTLGFNEQQQQQQIKTGHGFIAALDQSGGSTPSALRLWNVKHVVPFLKVDQGIEAEKNGVQLLKPMPALAALLDKAKDKGIFGTKMRSFIKQAGIKNIVRQQFEVAREILAAGLLPIIEPEVDIHCPERARAEEFLKGAILDALDELPAGRLVMLKLTLPEPDDFYADCVRHSKVLRVVALSGGFTRQEANDRLRRNHGVVARFFAGSGKRAIGPAIRCGVQRRTG